MRWLQKLFQSSDGLYTYTWVPRPTSPPESTPRGSFSVDKTKVRRGEFAWVDLQNVYFSIPFLFTQEFRHIDSGCFEVDRKTGFVLGGSLHGYSTDGHGATFGQLSIHDDNVFGRSFYGRWDVTFEFTNARHA